MTYREKVIWSMRYEKKCYITNVVYLYVVALVWCRNHIDVKLMASPKKPLKIITAQKIGFLRRGLQIHFIPSKDIEVFSCGIWWLEYDHTV